MNTAAQIKKIIQDEKFSFYRLENAAGEYIIPFNSKKPNDAEHLKKILFAIDQGKALPNGKYFVVCSNSTQSRSVKTRLEFLRGDAGNAMNEIQTVKAPKEPPAQLPAGYSISDLLKLTSELGQLRARVESLESENARLQKEIENLEDELATEEAAEQDSALGETTAPGQMDVGKILQLKMLELVDRFLPKPDGMNEKPAEQPTKKMPITYEQILNLLKNTAPDVVEKLSNDLNAHYATQYQPDNNPPDGNTEREEFAGSN